MEKVTFQNHVTPSGIAVYPRLNRPDTKFNADGVYSVKLLFDKNAVKQISDVVKPLMNGGQYNPIQPELDDQGGKTGNYLVNFKLKAYVRKKDGSGFSQKPILEDTNGNRVMDMIGGGSRLQIQYQPIPYNGMGGGVSLRLKKVRVLDLVEYQSKNTLDWGDEKGSYVAPPDISQEVKEVVDEDEEDF